MSVVTFMPIGRLGNNMFQTAACIGYAKKHGFKWLIPHHRRNGDNDPWLLPTFWPNLPFGDFNGDRYEQHDPKDFNYKPIPEFPRGVKFVGFFQSEKWFENAKEEVKAAFPLQHYPEYEGYVSIHVRRGDYVTNSNSFPPVDDKYIYKAFDNLAFKVREGGVLWFSDDITWCKEFVNNRLEALFSDYEGGKKSYPINHVFNEDSNEYTALSKMASCSHHIIANSSFSWWGAWLGHNPNKIVVAPHPEDWFGRGFTGSTPVDLLPSEWVKIKFR